MSLWPLATVENCIEYLDFGDAEPILFPGVTYNDWLQVAPRHYLESLYPTLVKSFFYDPSNDAYVCHFYVYYYYWPSWKVYRVEWNAADGSIKNKEEIAWGGIYDCTWATPGTSSRIFKTRSSSLTISECQWDTLAIITGGWSDNPNTWNPPGIYTHALVNLLDDYLVGVSSWHLDIWNDITGTPSRVARFRVPHTLGSLCMEDRKRLWLITSTGGVAKLNYQVPRWELLTTLQDPVGDATDFKIAWDSRRKRVAVLRIRPDASDGQCNCQLELYRPLVKVAADGLTAPVPVSSLRTSRKVQFVAHLVGEAGEGITPARIDASLLAPVDGVLRTPNSGTNAVGAAYFQYEAPASACDETLKLDATILEGE